LKFELGDATVYSRVYKQLLNEAKAITPHGRDIAKMMAQGSDVDFTTDCPKKRVIVEANAEKKKSLEEQEQTLYTIKTKKWVDRCDVYEQNKTVLCSLIAKRCDTELSDRLESRPGYHDWTLDKPLIFLRMVKDECVASAANVYPCYTQLKTFKDLHNIQQEPAESIADYTKRVRVHWELLRAASQVYYDRINATLYDNYYTKDATERLQLNQQSDEQFVAYILIVGADPIRFGDMIERLENSYSVGNNNYPRTLNDAKL
jgi:hypothetical protein